jgi:hypothetical protein
MKLKLLKLRKKLKLRKNRSQKKILQRIATRKDNQ